MNLNSRLFDRIRIRRKCEEPREAQAQGCERPGCAATGLYRAPKGRGKEGQYWRFCLDHVREYNPSYNYFAGMSDDAVSAFQKDAVIGHRPTWAMGANAAPRPRNGIDAEATGRDWEYFDPLGILRSTGVEQGRQAPPEPKRRRYSGPIRQALDMLGLDDSADATAIKAQYKALVKRFHPDAHGGDRGFEERLRDIIKAHDTLKAAGLC